MKPLLPKHVMKTIGSTRRWRAKKRRELDQAIKACEVVLLGAAWAPGDVLGILYKLRDLRKQWKVKNWSEYDKQNSE